MGRGTIQSDSAVFLVSIHESYIGPHMALDHSYYIRAGAHTVKAKHFIVDAIWAKRHLSKPRLIHSLRLKPDKTGVIQLGILALTDAPAIDVVINVEPIPELFKLQPGVFPLHLSLIDRSNSFFLDIASSLLPQKAINLEVEYHDLAGNSYEYKTIIESFKSILPIARVSSSNFGIMRA